MLGGHGDTMVPVPNRTTVSGRPLMDFVKEGKISSARLDEIIDRTRKGGAEVVKLLTNWLSILWSGSFWCRNG